jgi:hypothetical protein
MEERKKMNRRARMGELLSRMVPLSGHDVEEILQEQSNNRRKFGEIALSWGLCRPEHVWDAWCQQSADGTEVVDLEKIGIDTQAAALLTGDVARELSVIPVRVSSDAVLLAIAETPSEDTSKSLTDALHRRIKFVRANPEQLRAMIELYYPITPA